MTTTRLLVGFGLVATILALQARNLYSVYGPDPTMAPVRTPSEPTTVELTGRPVRGEATADVVVVEFSDYQCPYSALHATGAGREIEDELIATGEVRHVVVNNPLPQHDYSRLLASAAICAGRQGKYWSMYQALFENQSSIGNGIVAIARELGLDLDRFEECLGDGAVSARIEADVKTAKGFGLTLTPVYAIGRVNVPGRVDVVKYVLGVQPIETFRAVISDVTRRGSGTTK